MVTAEYALARRVSRRRMLGETVAAVAGVGVLLNLPMIKLPFLKQQLLRPGILGVTFSQLQCSPGYLDMDYQQTFKELCDLGPDVIRLGTYWNEIESDVGFQKTDWLMDEAARRNINVILTVGAKAPRVPELHLPPDVVHLSGTDQHDGRSIGSDPETYLRVMQHIEKVIEKYKNYPNLKYWQVENEPLDHLDFADNHSIDEKLLADEFKLVSLKKRADQEILLSNAFKIPSAPQSLIKSLELKPDGTGFNIYPKVPRKEGGYHQMTWGDYRLLAKNASLIKSLNIEPWIFEAQAEPWEAGKHVHFGQATFPSVSPEQTIRLISDLTKSGFDKQLLWGGEFWVKQKQLGFPEWMDTMKKLFSQKAA